MTKEITKAIILQEIQDKLKMREFAPAKFLFDETVVPVYNIERHLDHWITNFVNVAITSTGPRILFTVPADERWFLRRYDAVFMTGVYTITGMYTRRHDMDQAYFCYLDLGAGTSISYHIDLLNPIVLDPGDIIAVNVDGYTSTGDFRLYIDYLKEEIR